MAILTFIFLSKFRLLYSKKFKNFIKKFKYLNIKSMKYLNQEKINKNARNVKIEES